MCPFVAVVYACLRAWAGGMDTRPRSRLPDTARTGSREEAFAPRTYFAADIWWALSVLLPDALSRVCLGRLELPTAPKGGLCRLSYRPILLPCGNDSASIMWGTLAGNRPARYH